MTKKFKVLVLMMPLSLGTGLMATPQGFAAENNRPRWMEQENGARPVEPPGKVMRQEMGPGRGGPGMEHPMGQMEKDLNLNAEQKTQIRSIHEKERATIAPLMKKHQDIMGKIEAAAKVEPFDEKTVRALAESQAAVQADLTVAHLRTQSQVNAILTTEQRIKAEKTRSEQRKMHRPPGGSQTFQFPLPNDLFR